MVDAAHRHADQAARRREGGAHDRWPSPCGAERDQAGLSLAGDRGAIVESFARVRGRRHSYRCIADSSRHCRDFEENRRIHRGLPGRRQSRDEQGVALARIPDRHAWHDLSALLGSRSPGKRSCRRRYCPTSTRGTTGSDGIFLQATSTRHPTSWLSFTATSFASSICRSSLSTKRSAAHGRAGPASIMNRSFSARWEPTSPITASR